MFNKFLLTLLLSLSCVFVALGQGSEINGRVVCHTNVTKPPVGKKSFDIEPLSGVSVLEDGTTNSTLTDVDGNFKINVINKNAVLRFEYKGFKKNTVRINGQNKVYVVLKRKRG